MGKVDKITGQIVPTRKKGATENLVTSTKISDKFDLSEVTVKVGGPYLLLEKITEKLDLKNILAKCFPETYLEILSMVYYVVQKSQTLTHINSWSLSHKYPFGQSISDQRVSELFSEMSEKARKQFFSLWFKKVGETDCLCYDISPVTSDTHESEYLRFELKDQKEYSYPINLVLIIGSTSGLLVCCRRILANIYDAPTIKLSLKNLHFIKAQNLNFIMYREMVVQTNN
jgi:hypothetical protein